jgi:hypothetical protein
MLCGQRGFRALSIERTASENPSVRLIKAVARRTEGNPFFVGEVVRWLVAQGQLPVPLELPHAGAPCQQEVRVATCPARRDAAARWRASRQRDASQVGGNPVTT